MKVSDGRAIVILLAVLFGGTTLSLVLFSTPEGRRSVWISATVALVVQSLAFIIVRNAPPHRVLGAWGAAAMLRFLALFVYALVLIKPLHLSPVPALVSLAALFFITTVFESLLFKP